MDCRDAERFVQLRLDGEIEAVDCMALDRHLEGCPHCRERVERERVIQGTLRGKLKDGCSHEEAQCPPAMRDRILSRLAEEERRRTGLPMGRAVAVVGGVGLLAALSWGATSSSANDFEETVARHSSNLPPEVRVVTTDDAEVHRFLEKNLRYPVQIPRFERQDLPVRLVGARLSNISDRDAAYMMYDERGAKLSLFAYPVPRRFVEPEGFEHRSVGDKVFLVGKRRGYNVVAWRDQDLLYSLVSDVDPGELVRLASTAKLGAH
jgi:anti-sigma factor RsiW